MDVKNMNRCTNRRRIKCLVAIVLVAAVSACATPDATTSSALGEDRWDDDVFALSAEAESAYQEGRWIDAVRHYETLTHRVPQDSYSWFRLGNAYARQGDYDRAIPAYESSLSRDASQAKPWFNLSSAYLLNAQRAMQNAHDSLRPGDPARHMLQRRLMVLDGLLHDRFEDQPGPGSNVSYR